MEGEYGADDQEWRYDVQEDGMALSASDSNYTFDGNNSYDYRMETFEEYWYASVEYIWWKNLKTYVPPVLILLGSIGNVLAFVALTRKHMQHNSVCFYFAVLCIMDTVVLYVGCGLHWLSYVSETPHIANLADPVCKIWMFFFKLLLSMSSWLIVATLIDRFLVMWHPIKAQSLCTVFLAKVVTVMILVALVAVSIHAMWTMTLEETQGYCMVDTSRRDFQTVVWPIIEASLNNYLPMLLVITFTSVLIAGCVVPHARGDSEYQQMRLTRAAIALGLAYFLLELPTIVTNFIVYFQPRLDHAKRSQLYLTQEICQVLRCLNNAVIFSLLFLSLPMLRYEVWSLLQHLKPVAGNSGASDRELQGVAPTAEQLLPQTTSIEVSSDATLL